jgi:hypothetical protein
VVSLATGTTAVIDSSVAWFQFGANGLLYSTQTASGGTLTVAAPADAHSTVVLSEGINQGSASISPDGTLVEAIDGNGTLYLGGVSQTMQAVASSVSVAAFFVDGSLLFLSGSSTLSILRPGETSATVVSENAGSFQLTPDGAGALISDPSNTNFGSVGPGSTEVTVLANNGTVGGMSADGSCIFLFVNQEEVSASENTVPVADLIVARIDGSAPLQALGLAEVNTASFVGPSEVFAIRFGTPSPYPSQDGPYLIQVP